MIDFSEAPLTDEPALRTWLAEQVGVPPWTISFQYFAQEEGIRGIMQGSTFDETVAKWTKRSYHRESNPSITISITVRDLSLWAEWDVVANKEGQLVGSFASRQ